MSGPINIWMVKKLKIKMFFEKCDLFRWVEETIWNFELFAQII
jgi:hypothetical protein